MPRVRRQGYGLGNEFVPWARAFLASQVLGARLLPPAFGLNRRGYWRTFGTSPDDWLLHRTLERVLPVVEFTEADYLRHGGGDVVPALRAFAAERALQRRKAYLFVTEGLWGGFRHVAAAREYIRATLYQSRSAARNLLTLRARLAEDKPLVGMHIRMGDFAPPVDVAQYRKVPNASLPLEWFHAVAASLHRAFEGDWQLLLITDGTQDQMRPLLDAFPCVTTADLSDNDCSDLLALAGSDLLVCSASTYSALAAFLSDAPYLWFAPSLHSHPEGCYSTHGFKEERARPQGPTAEAVRRFENPPRPWRSRGIAVDMDGKVPADILQYVLLRRELRQAHSDLVRSGVTPWPAPPAPDSIDH